MRFRPDANYAAFLQAVGKCRGKVWLKTKEGDCLDLSSALSRFVFIAAVSDNQLDKWIEVEENSDADLLAEFFAEAV